MSTRPQNFHLPSFSFVFPRNSGRDRALESNCPVPEKTSGCPSLFRQQIYKSRAALGAKGEQSWVPARPPARVCSCTSATRAPLHRSCLGCGIISLLCAGKSPTVKGTSLLWSHTGLRLLFPEKLLKGAAGCKGLSNFSVSTSSSPFSVRPPIPCSVLRKTEIHRAPLVRI